MDFNIKKQKEMNLKRELPLWAMISLPFIYLAYCWNDLPERVPIHWNIDGEVDNWSTKAMLWLVPILLPLLLYVIFLFVKQFDPKKRIEKMGSKFYTLRFVLIAIFSVLALYIIYASGNGGKTLNTNMLLVIIGVLFATLGNFLKTIQPNYFIGIRTPWTLENEDIWKATHLLGGKLFFIGGILIVLLALLTDSKISIYGMLGITFISSGWTVIYSFIKGKQLKEQQEN